MRIIIVDDHPIIYECLPIALQDEPDIEVVGSYGSSTEALRVVMESPPDVLILDLCMPEMDGISFIKCLKAANRSVPTVIFSCNVSEEQMMELLQLGVKGVVDKGMAIKQLVMCLKKVHAGGDWLEKNIVTKVLERLLQQNQDNSPDKTLTPREKELISLIAEGKSNRGIAEALYISESTVKTHLTNIYQKLGVNSRIELLRHWQAHS